MEREGKGTGGNLFRGLAAFCTPFFASGGLRWWERIFQGAVGILEMNNWVRGSIDDLFLGWAKLGVLLWTRFFRGE